MYLAIKVVFAFVNLPANIIRDIERNYELGLALRMAGVPAFFSPLAVLIS
jgi:hypothetical protein